MSAETQSGFTHLHLHTQYSLLDGAIRMDDLCEAVKEKGMNSVAVTDHGNMFGAVHFYKEAQKHGVKPIFGCESYVANKGRFDRSGRDSSHLVLLAKNNEGYKNLSYLISMGYLEGYYYEPRIDKEILRKHSKGLYATSACLGGIVNKCLMREGEAKAAQTAKEFRDIFEPGHFFLELQDNGYEEQRQANEVLMEIGRTYDIPMVATADSHYLTPQDSEAHEILMCIGQSKTLDEFRQKMHHSDLLYLKTPEEMWSSFQRSCPEAVENAVRIGQNCNVELNLNETFLPNFAVPKGTTREVYLEQLAYEGLKKRIAGAPYPIDVPAYKQRLEHEVGIINRMGFAGYFLIVWDFINHAKRTGVPVGPGRGSGAGSLVAWCLEITDLDPIPYDLIFERFLNPERVSMPDFDIDFCQDRRGDVIKYVSEKYGSQNVAQIVTYSQLSAKSVIKDVGRVMNLPFAEVNELTKLIPGLINGKKVSIDQALELEPKLRNIQKEKPIYKQVINIARALEGLNRQTGVHAAGVVIGDKPLWEYIPMCRSKEGDLVTQFAKDEVEEAGLVKFDFLGLKTLTVIAKAVDHVRKRPDVASDFDVANLGFNDPKVYELIARADTDGVFQLESSGFKELLKRLKPDCFEDIVAAVALYRPGPLDAGMVEDYINRKHGRAPVEYAHPACEPILKTTYGVIVYQEQVMRIAVDLCGFTMGEADMLRKAMGKKKADVMAAQRAQFVQGAFDKHGMQQEDAETLFSQIEKFAGYCFNKSHSAAYAVITYRTGYLKAYYPVEFMAALLSTEMRQQDNVVKYIQSAREDGILIRSPDVNLSERDFSVVTHDKNTQAILFGLGAVKGIGDAVIDAIMEARKNSPFLSMFDLCERVDLRRMNKKAIDALIKSGAFDCFKKPRAHMAGAIERALETGQRAQKDRESGQTNLFAAFMNIEKGSSASSSTSTESYPTDVTWDSREVLRFEKESLGFYITGHPMDGFAADLKRMNITPSSELHAWLARSASPFAKVQVAGVVSAIKERPLKSGQGRMAFCTLEDLHGSCELLLFSKAFAEAELQIKSDEPLLVTGTVTLDGEDDEEQQAKLRVTSVEYLSEARRKQTQRVELHLHAQDMDDQKLKLFRELLRKHEGVTPVVMLITQEGQSRTRLELPAHLRVTANDGFIRATEGLFGSKAVSLH